MQARVIRDAAATALGDRAWQRSLGASCLLHGAVLAALLTTWHIEPKPQPLLRPIPVSLSSTPTRRHPSAPPNQRRPRPNSRRRNKKQRQRHRGRWLLTRRHRHPHRR